MSKQVVMRQGIREGSVVQLNPDECKNPMLAGCMLTVTLVRNWGVQGYIQEVGENGKQGTQVHYRARWVEIERVGSAPWMLKNEE